MSQDLQVDRSDFLDTETRLAGTMSEPPALLEHFFHHEFRRLVVILTMVARRAPVSLSSRTSFTQHTLAEPDAEPLAGQAKGGEAPVAVDLAQCKRCHFGLLGGAGGFFKNGTGLSSRRLMDCR
jgi:hypothetical protein